jgi:arylsulfatase A-like enzyme/Tfp pilus assembly protein PilF
LASPKQSSRWPFIAVGVVAFALAAGAIYRLSRAPAFELEPSSDQNIVLITIDTLRADAMSSYGGPAKTPNIDALAAGGARFTFAHAHTVLTLPSHTTILSGRLPYEHGVRDNGGFRVREGTQTLATRLKPLGFVTGAFVGGFPLTKRFGLTPGFDVYDDQMPEMRGAIEASMPERPADAVVSRALDWVGKQSGKFFLWVHVYDPHSPYRPPADLAGQYSSQPYYGEVAFVDRAFGPLFDRLRGLQRRTTIVLTADHGESLGEHGEATHGMFAYESTLRVPLIIARLGGATRSARGIVIDTPVRHIDIVPTVLDAIGAPADASLQGTSLLSVLQGRRNDNESSYFEAMSYNLVRGWAPLRGVLQGREKYIDLPIPELYDVAKDPHESTNLMQPEADRARVMLNLLRQYNVAPPDRPSGESQQTQEALRSLGYVTGTAPAKTTYTEADDPKTLVKIDEDLHTATDLVQQGHTREAIKVFESVIARRPQTADAYTSLAHTQWESGDPGAAIATLTRALQNGAPERDVRIRLGLYLAESHADPKQAIAVLEGRTGEDVEALTALGVAYADAGRSEDAVRMFTRVLTLDPTNGIAYQNVASITLREALSAKDNSERASKLLDAEKYANDAITADPALGDAYTTLGVIQSTTGRKPAAIESWKRAVELDHEQFNALYDLWFELAAAGRRDEASKYGRQFVATAPPALFISDIEEVKRYLRER